MSFTSAKTLTAVIGNLAHQPACRCISLPIHTERHGQKSPSRHRRTISRTVSQGALRLQSPRHAPRDFEDLGHLSGPELFGRIESETGQDAPDPISRQTGRRAQIHAANLEHLSG